MIVLVDPDPPAPIVSPNTNTLSDAVDVFASTIFHGTTGESSFGISVGTLVLLINVILLGGYTLGCHSFRHMVGGIRNKFRGGGGKAAESCWKACTKWKQKQNSWEKL